MAIAEKAAEKMCTKCEKNPKAGGPEDKNPWCKECRAEYQRERAQGLEWRSERRGLIRGIRAMRESLSAYFRAMPRHLAGPEVASIIETLPGPSVAGEDAAKSE